MAVAMALTRLVTFGIAEATKPQEVRNWEVGKEVWYRPVTRTEAEIIVAEINHEREKRDIEAREPSGSEWEFAVAGFVGSFVDPIALGILAFFTFVTLKLLPRRPTKVATNQA
ncbi:MAG TPA: hypothetical protein VII63_07520 [Caulobacteraceae bacterium]